MFMFKAWDIKGILLLSIYSQKMELINRSILASDRSFVTITKYGAAVCNSFLYSVPYDMSPVCKNPVNASAFLASISCNRKKYLVPEALTW